MILPDCKKAKAFTDALPFTVLCNDGEAQMIRTAVGEIYGVFHKPCEKFGISVDAPLLIAVKNDGIYICDATQKTEHACITVNGDSFCVTFPDNATVKIS